MQGATSAAVLCASEWRPQALANTAWSYGHLAKRESSQR